MTDKESDYEGNNEEYIYEESSDQISSLNRRYKGVVLVFYGFDLMSNHNPGVDFIPAFDAIRLRVMRLGYKVILAEYDTHKSFFVGATRVYKNLVNSDLPLNNVHMFGYSMGGLVARQVAALGITPKTLVTFCTPNLGILEVLSKGSLITFNDGIMSMATYSQDLKNLNNHPRDIKLRHRYTMIGLRYSKNTDGRDVQDNDSIVDITSAVMDGARPPPGEKCKWFSIRRGFLLPPEPHKISQTLPDAQSAINLFCSRIK